MCGDATLEREVPAELRALRVGQRLLAADAGKDPLVRRKLALALLGGSPIVLSHQLLVADPGREYLEHELVAR
ncbi:MAG: hypothetical protein M3Q39_14665 [Actinomycetota bacterium]|nr:hypothetical protein [Actinomycetota bacterium]MDQ3422649.1 hypothetical protein [Actinomycetota bacterium]